MSVISLKLPGFFIATYGKNFKSNEGDHNH